MFNKVIEIGRLTKDPEVRNTENATHITTFPIAVERDFKSDKNDGQAETDFFDVVAFSSTADFISKWFKKGMLILVEGRLQSRKWKDKEGNNRTFVEIVAENVKFAEPKKDRSDHNSEVPKEENAGCSESSEGLPD